jgi:TetR/AcrR family transcriptional regulator, cholesterol catabolism regulator
MTSTRLVTAPQSTASMTPNQLARRARVTAAVIELMDDLSPDRLQMRDVAERSGVSLGTVYRYFSSKDHLLAATWVVWHRQLTERAHAELAVGRSRREPASVQDLVSAYVSRELRAFQRHPNFARLVCLVQNSTDPFASEEFDTVSQDSTGLMAELMTGTPPDVARPAAIAINAVVGVGILSWVTGRKTWSEISAQAQDVIQLVLADH